MTTPPPRPRRLAMMTDKGGAQKTTTALERAAARARAGLTTLLVDGDPQANLTRRARAFDDTRKNIYDVLRIDSDRPITDAITRCGWESPEAAYIYVVQGSLQLEDVVREAAVLGARTRLRRLLDDLPPEWADRIGEIIIDTKGGNGHLVHVAATALDRPGDAIWLPVCPEADSINGAQRVVGYLPTWRDELGVPSLRVGGVIACNYQENTILHGGNLAGLTDAMATVDPAGAIPVLDTGIPARTSIAVAHDEARPLSAYPKSKTGEPIAWFDALRAEMDTTMETQHAR